MTTIGRRDAEAARRYNLAKRAAQTEKLNELAARMEGALFILGDYNSPDPQKEVSFPLLGLRHGYSFDNWTTISTTSAMSASAATSWARAAAMMPRTGASA